MSINSRTAAVLGFRDAGATFTNGSIALRVDLVFGNTQMMADA